MVATVTSPPSSKTPLTVLASQLPVVATPSLPFEEPLVQLRTKIAELEALSAELHTSTQGTMTMDKELSALVSQYETLRHSIYDHLTPANQLQIIRHPNRPNCLEVIEGLVGDSWFELHGDRGGCDDRAIVGGMGEFVLEEGKPAQPVMLVGTQKGRTMKDNLIHNFGMANPEGYRKAMRLFNHANKFNMPIITFIDTPGAYPGMDGEQKGIGQAIAWNIREMARLGVPIISVVLGEASSGGALGIGVANRIFMLEHALYTVISPEGCASILWRSAEKAADAADALKITANDLLAFGICDAKIPEPMGGAHYDAALTIERIKAQVAQGLNDLRPLSPEQRTQQRYEKYRAVGAFEVAKTVN
ncbi:MAG: acetyl-CoA carboxylase carboxyltransferase subunit alpha [Vampirovibrionales bacterium]